QLSNSAMQKLTRAPWPGNVRQLENAMKSSALLSRTEIITGAELRIPEEIGRPRISVEEADDGPPLQPAASSPGLPAPSASMSGSATPQSFELQASSSSADAAASSSASRIRNRSDWEAHEKERILGALIRCNWNKTRAATLLNVSRRNLYRKIARYGIEGTI
ncbi:MAG: hypothetical protein KC620_20500, partial [Myxococcales bacterium]|nr:hypothetical protein [Myxococcales bacterium]